MKGRVSRCSGSLLERAAVIRHGASLFQRGGAVERRRAQTEVATGLTVRGDGPQLPRLTVVGMPCLVLWASAALEGCSVL